MGKKLSARRWIYDRGLRALLWLCGGLVCALLVFIIGYIFARGLPRITWELLSTQSSVLRGTVGILPHIASTVYIILVAMVIVLPLGVMILPTIIRTTQESLKTVPQSYREGALGLGAGKWHMIRTVVLPNAVDGIVTGCILAVGRIVGESAALLFTAGFGTVLYSFAQSLNNSSATLTVALYLYANERGETEIAFAIAAILMILTLVINLAAGLVGRRLKK